MRERRQWRAVIHKRPARHLLDNPARYRMLIVARFGSFKRTHRTID
jgi:hypothetical protein